MAWFQRSERGIGRGEVAESRMEAPFFAAFMVLCALGLFFFHFYFQNGNWTAALAVSLIVFGATVIRVDFGIYILAISMLLSPEFEVGAVGQHEERSVNIRYDDILIVVIFLGVLVKLAFEGRVTLWRPNPINPAIAAYYFVCIVASLDAWRWSLGAWDKSVALFVLIKMLQFYMVFVMVGLAVDTRLQLRRQLTVFFSVAMIVCLYGIYSIGTLSRVSAPFEAGGTEPNTFGGYITIVVCLAAGLYAYAPRRRWKMLFLLMGIVAFIPFIMTLSRASYIALLFALTVLGIMSRRMGIISAVVLVLFLSPFLMPQDVMDRVNYTFQRGSGEAVIIGGRDMGFQIDKSSYERIYVWRKVQFNLKQWPFLGGGVSWETVLDSQYARVLIETGLIGFSAFVFLLYRVLRTTREGFIWSRDWVAKGLCLGITSAAAGLIVHSLGTISFLIVRIMEPFWFLVALAVVARDLALRDHAQRVREWYAQRAPDKEGESSVESYAPGAVALRETGHTAVSHAP